ncbi:MAG: hypothetical protein C0467_10935 [Planctomycetaceae bacterium]|nr:hypothetical protein [Planctomycetaceae bacterium]
MARRWAMVAVIGFAGCESLKTSPAPAPTEPVPVVSAPPRVAAKQSVVVPASATEPRLEAEPDPAPDPLSLAAECLVRGDHANAAVHLESHVREHPDQLMFRAQLADLLVRVGREETAKVHYERFAIDARRSTGVPRKHLVHVHTRLMELAQRDGDRNTEVFHRGVGLLLLTEEQDGLPDRDEGFCEEMLCKAMKALTEAKELNPGDARVRLRLAEVYDRMGNRRAADAERAVARTAVLPSGSGPILTLRE